ncbi:hypothetical protein IM40_05150 [Candidatus Paracaedimonas acanthamoebae]|nr:hypothetical protein IM40_05150 [Candidatus Paracaedimonas acanthamoebae]
MKTLSSKIAYIIVSLALLSCSQAEASFIEHQLKSKEQHNQEKVQKDNRRRAVQDFLRSFIQRAITQSTNKIQNHILRLHKGGIEKISTTSFGNRNYYSLFNENQINSVQAFQNKAIELLNQTQLINYNGANQNNRIKIILNSSSELGRYFTQEDYNHALNMQNTGHPENPLQAGQPGMKLVLILQSSENIYNELQNMVKGNRRIPQSANGFTPTIVTAFLEQ